MEPEPRDVGDIPPDRRTEDKPEGADPDRASRQPSPERLGPTPAPGDEVPEDEESEPDEESED